MIPPGEERRAGLAAFGFALALLCALLAVWPTIAPAAPERERPPLETEPDFWNLPETEREVETVDRETQLSIHLYVLVGGVLFIVFVIALLIVLYFWTALPFTAWLIGVVLPIVALGFFSMCLFAFIGWMIGQRLLVTQICAFAGAIVGIAGGAYTFYKKGAEIRPISWSDRA